MKPKKLNQFPNENVMQLHQHSEITEGLITDKTILFLRRMFSDPDKYRYYINTLVIMRKLIASGISYDGTNIDENHEQYPIYKTLNELIGVLESGRDTRIAPVSGLMLGNGR